MKMTEALIEQAKTEKGGYTKAQVEAIGLTWPLSKGWKQSLIGKDFPEHQIKEFITARTRLRHTVHSAEDSLIFKERRLKSLLAEMGKLMEFIREPDGSPRYVVIDTRTGEQLFSKPTN